MFFESKKGERVLVAFLLLLLILPNIMVASLSEELDGFWVKKIGYLLVSSAGLFLPAIFLKRKSYFFFMGVFSLLLAPIEMASICFNHVTTHFMMMDTLFSTNWQESVEFFSSLWPIVLLTLGVWMGYFFLTFKYVRNEDFFPKKVKRYLLVSLPVVFLIGFFYFFTLARLLLTNEGTTILDNLSDVKGMMEQKVAKVFPFDVYMATSDVLAHRAEVRECQAQLADFSFGISPKMDDEEEVYVLVIGEAARWQNFGVNGYSRNTTPNLSRQKNLISYDHFMTQANLTSRSVPLIVTRADAQHREIAAREKSLSEAFAEAGFFTAWISSQELTSYQERIIAACDTSFNLNKTITGGRKYDLDMLPAFASVINAPAKKKFIVVHTMGSHFKYNERYPEDSVFFRPSFDNSMDFLSASSENAEYLVNAYDNTIRYTDAFLSSLIKRLEAKGGVWAMLYLADHGENLYDDERKLILHGTLVVSEYEAHIPFFVAYSDGYQSRYADKVESIKENKAKNITSGVVFHSLLDMAGIQSDVVVDSLCIGKNKLVDLANSYVLNGNMEPIFFDFKQLENVK